MTLQHIQEIMLEMAQDDSPLKTAFEQLNQKAITFPQNSVIVPPILEIIQSSSPNIGCCESCITIPFPQQYSNQIQGLSSDVADSLGGATVLPNFLGWWKNQNGEIIPDQLVAIKSFTQVKNLVNNWEKLLARIHYWGKMSQQEEIAIELSVFALGSVLLLISIES
ncbi:MAG TPA: hypothetical protein V6D21_24890 [Candidatus Obscuribacterales bacterium]